MSLNINVVSRDLGVGGGADTIRSIHSPMLRDTVHVKDRKNDVKSLVTSYNDAKSLITFLDPQLS